jgi:hypothetical protein
VLVWDDENQVFVPAVWHQMLRALPRDTFASTAQIHRIAIAAPSFPGRNRPVDLGVVGQAFVDKSAPEVFAALLCVGDGFVPRGGICAMI